MNMLVIIGNLTRDPETRTTTTGKSVCSFTMAVNRRSGGQRQTDFFRVSAWEKLGETCMAYLSKGRKVCVTGSVSCSAHTGQDGKTYANMEVNADHVEFLTSRQDLLEEDRQNAGQAPAPREEAKAPKQEEAAGFTLVDDDDELPF